MLLTHTHTHTHTHIYIYIYIYIDIVPDIPDTSGESKNNIGCLPVAQKLWNYIYIYINTYIYIYYM